MTCLGDVDGKVQEGGDEESVGDEDGVDAQGDEEGDGEEGGGGLDKAACKGLEAGTKAGEACLDTAAAVGNNWEAAAAAAAAGHRSRGLERCCSKE